MKNATDNNSKIVPFNEEVVMLRDFYQFPEEHPLFELNEMSMQDALKEILQGIEYTRVFSTHVRTRLEPILSIEFEQVDKNKIMEVVIGISKSIMQDKLTPAFLKDKNDDNTMLKTIDKQFADAGMALNLEGIFSMPESTRSFLLYFIRYWGMYFDANTPVVSETTMQKQLSTI